MRERVVKVVGSGLFDYCENFTMQAPTDIRTLLLATDSKQTPVSEHEAGSSQPLVHTPYGSRPPLPSGRSLIGFNGQFRETLDWYLLGNGHRIYNPALMLFHSPDRLSPFALGGLNPYAYCLGDPVNRSDPTGRISQDAVGPLLTMFLHSGGFLTAGLHMVFGTFSGAAALANGTAMLGSTLSMTGAGGALGGVDGAQALMHMGTGIAGLVSYSRIGLLLRAKSKARKPPAQTTATPPTTPLPDGMPMQPTSISRTASLHSQAPPTPPTPTPTAPMRTPTPSPSPPMPSASRLPGELSGLPGHMKRPSIVSTLSAPAIFGAGFSTPDLSSRWSRRELQQRMIRQSKYLF